MRKGRLHYTSFDMVFEAYVILGGYKATKTAHVMEDTTRQQITTCVGEDVTYAQTFPLPGLSLMLHGVSLLSCYLNTMRRS